jgi:hypothetical protein
MAHELQLLRKQEAPEDSAKHADIMYVAKHRICPGRTGMFGPLCFLPVSALSGPVHV